MASCVAAHSTLADMQSVPVDTVAAIRMDQSIVDAKLQALRVFIRILVENRGWLDQQHMPAFYSAGYKPGHVMDVLVGIAQKTMSDFTNHIAQTPLDGAFQARAGKPESKTADYS